MDDSGGEAGGRPGREEPRRGGGSCQSPRVGVRGTGRDPASRGLTALSPPPTPAFALGGGRRPAVPPDTAWRPQSTGASALAHVPRTGRLGPGELPADVTSPSEGEPRRPREKSPGCQGRGVPRAAGLRLWGGERGRGWPATQLQGVSLRTQAPGQAGAACRCGALRTRDAEAERTGLGPGVAARGGQAASDRVPPGSPSAPSITALAPSGTPGPWLGCLLQTGLPRKGFV